MAMTLVTVFGGTGFLGRRIVERLLMHGLSVRIATRHPERRSPLQGAEKRTVPVQADVQDDGSVTAAIVGAQAVVNAVSLYVERGSATFRSIHVDGARRVAEVARRQGVERLLHLSGIGAEPTSPSEFVRCRAEGERVVREVLDGAVIFRPSVMFGHDDAFLTTLASLTRWLPILPLFGRGDTRLQPAFVEDVAHAAANALTAPRPPERLYELGGPHVHTYREVLELVLRTTGRRRLLLPVPMFVWEGLAAASGILPTPPLTEGQVALLKRDNVASPDAPGLRDLGVSPTAMAAVLERHFAPH